MNKIDDTSRSAGYDRADDVKSDISATSAPIFIYKDENQIIPSY